jgi:rubrerythrin
VSSRTDVKRHRANLQDEIDGAAVYRSMAAAEADPHLATVYKRLAEVEERHASVWEAQLKKAGVKNVPRTPSVRTRILMHLARRFATG